MIRRPPDAWLVDELLALSGQDAPPVDVAAIARELGFELRERDQVEDAMLIRDTGEIFVKEGASQARQRFSIGHELGHYVKGHEVAFARARGLGDRPAERREADSSAARLLMPEEWVRRANAELDGNLFGLAQRFDVSVPAMQIRLRELGLT
jgi:Zn-dependent peptidase ImmA (M78 family)